MVPTARVFTAILLILALTGPATSAYSQTTWLVDDDGSATATDCDGTGAAFLLPSAALVAAANGDTVLVCPGTYVGRVFFLGKAVTLRSVAGAGVTILDGNADGSVVTFASGEGRGSVIDGFTIRNGDADFEGGGIIIGGASPTIRNNTITANRASSGAGIAAAGSGALIERNVITANVSSGGGGGGIYLRHGSTVVVRENTITNNTGSAWGGGIDLFAADAPTIERNLIAGNSATSSGGGIDIVNEANATIVGNVIVRNSTSRQGGGIYLSPPDSRRGVLMVNNTIADNQSPSGSGLMLDGFMGDATILNNAIVASAGQAAVQCGNFGGVQNPTLRHNNVYSATGPEYAGFCADHTGVFGNISADPQFVDPSADNFHLQLGSPNVDAGDDQASGMPAVDIDGHLRILDGDRDGLPRVDIGADEAGATPPVDAANDFTGDGGMDLIFRHATTGDLVVWGMHGVTRLSSQMLGPGRVGLNWRAAGTADVNGDTKPDIVWQEESTGVLFAWFMDGVNRTGYTYFSIAGPADPEWRVVSVADLSGDGKADLIWQHASSGALAAWLLDGTTVTARLSLNPWYVADSRWEVVNTGDFNNDGKIDLLWKHRESGYMIVWFMDGVNRLDVGWLSPQLIDIAWAPVATGDLNADGKVDIVFQHPDGRLAAWFMDGVTRINAQSLRPGMVLDPRWRVIAPK